MCSKIYCCEIHVESRGFPHDLVKNLFPAPINLETYAQEHTLLNAELDLMDACEHYRNQSFIVHRNSYGHLMSAEIQLADFLGLTIDQYLEIVASPTG